MDHGGYLLIFFELDFPGLSGVHFISDELGGWVLGFV
jgi:hypothetical protein